MLRYLIFLLTGFIPLLAHPESCERLVSMAPSITEVVYTLGLDDKLLAVTRYDKFPADVKSKQQIGGFLDVNLEQLVSLEPTLVLSLSEHSSVHRKLEELNIKSLEFEHRSISGILSSIENLANRCGLSQKGQDLSASLSKRITQVRKLVRNQQRPGVLVVIGGAANDGDLSNVYISGKDGYFNELLEIAGARNVFTSPTAVYPQLSLEQLYILNPDVIFEIATPTAGAEISDRRVLEVWQQLPGLKAVEQKRIHVLRQDYTLIPGPRFYKTLYDIVDFLYPELQKQVSELREQHESNT